MKVAIMQPYFLAYVGYYQLIHSVDKFVIYDNLKYNKSSWVNRNRILLNGEDRLFTLPLKSDSDNLNNNERYLADNYKSERNKIIQWIKHSYKKAPFYNVIIQFIEIIFNQDSRNLFDFIYFSVHQICELLEIETEIIKSSSLKIDHSLKSEAKVIAICKYLNADIYINAIGGKSLYSKDSFSENNIALRFIKARKIEYTQFSNEFIPWLSIIDVLMFNGIDKTKNMLYEFDIE